MTTSLLLDAFTATDSVFTPDMATGVGMSRRRLLHLRTTGVIRRACGNAFVHSDLELTLRRRCIGAVLTWGDGIICLRTAGMIHGFDVDDGGLTDVLVPNGRRPTNGLVVHQWSLRPTQVEVRDGVRVTDRRTTLADLLGRLPAREAWALLAWLWTRDKITEADLASQIDERRHLYGVVRLRAMLAAVRDGALSMGEVRFHEFLRDHNICGWKGDQKIYRGRRVVARADVLFLDLPVILEFDGAIAHNDETAEHDAGRDALLRALGYVVVHVTWEKMYEHPRALLKEIAEALAEGARRISGETLEPSK